ncbi:hypothetical protein CsSME_00037451 [Camellia sinensis var. sinensis]
MILFSSPPVFLQKSHFVSGLSSQRQRQRGVMVAGSAIDSILKLLINSEDNLIANERHQILSLYNELRFLRAILKDMEEKHFEDDESENLAMQISCVAYDTEEIIRSFVTNVARQRDSNKGNKIGFVFDFRLNLSDIMEQINPIEVKVMQFYDKMYKIQVLHDRNTSDGAPSTRNRTSMMNRNMVQEEIIVGFDEEAMSIKEQLAGWKTELDIISIVGMPGLGKTTLARKVYNDPYIAHHFHIRAWANVSQVPRKREMLLDILHCVTVLNDKEEIQSNERLGEKLYKKLKGKKYLIVLDDIWDIGAWVDLKMYLPNDNNGSRVMFTSRLKEVAMHASPNSHPHCLRFLTEEEGWELLQWKVFQNESCPPKLIEIGKQIMKKCEGLPLAIVVIAGLLAKNKKTQEWWEQVAQSVSSYIVSDPNQYVDTLALSYDHLPHHLKPCFLYLGVFPEDQEIPVHKLIWLWVAEGFIQKVGQSSLEEVAEDYLMDLIQRSLVIGARKRFDGRIKSCRMHDLLRDLCLKKGREINFLERIYHYKDAYPPSSNYRTNNQCRLCIHSDLLEKFIRISLSYSPAIVQSFLCFSNDSEDKLRSVRRFASRNNPFDDVCSFIYQTFKLLRVLDLWSGNAYITSKLAQLVNLRYLAIMLNDYCELPPSISNLSNLETLIIFTYSEIILPHNFWTIPKLRHLYTKEARYSLPFLSEEAAMYDSCPSVLENLRTIANLKPYGPIQDLLARTPHLTKLGFRGPLISYSGRCMFPNLDSVRHLETLKLHNTFRIQSTNLQGVKFPANLKRLTLRYTGIEWKEISTLGMLLPNLELLKLESDACWGLQWATTDLGFLRLKFLKLKNLKVERWITCSSHFPTLQHLSLESCENLEEIPSSLGDVLTLEMIEVAFCHPSAEESAKKIKEEQDSNGNNGLKVLIRNT